MRQQSEGIGGRGCERMRQQSEGIGGRGVNE